ncbi:hypothetical protein FB451DRAFT_1208031 [Mycena latifolia]|nr:hypothetical protein FB451DRAFT_1208031 [Mycena latifolia]
MNGWLKTLSCRRLPLFSTRQSALFALLPNSSSSSSHITSSTTRSSSASLFSIAHYGSASNDVSSSNAQSASRRHFSQTHRAANDATAASPTPLTDAFMAARAIGPYDPPLMRRAVSVTNLPPDARVDQLLAFVHTGGLEYVKVFPGQTSSMAELSFLDGHSAARFIALTGSASAPLLLGGRPLACTWLPYKPLHPVIATAAANDRARRVLILYKARDRADRWSAPHLRVYLERGSKSIVALTTHAVDKDEYNEVAVVHFGDIASAIRTHAFIRADPGMVCVRVAYGPDPCEAPPGTPAFSLADAHAALKTELGHAPTYFSDAHGGARPFTALVLRNLDQETTVADLCERIYSGPLYAVDLLGDGTAVVSFFRMEDARDFLVGVSTRGLTIRHRAISVEPHHEEESATPALPPECTRVLRVRIFIDSAVTITLPKLQADFGLFGTIDRVWAHPHPRKQRYAFVAFARADDALRAFEHIAVADPVYLACNLRFAPDPCARRIPEGDAGRIPASDRVLAIVRGSREERQRRWRERRQAEVEVAGRLEGSFLATWGRARPAVKEVKVDLEEVRREVQLEARRKVQMKVKRKVISLPRAPPQPPWWVVYGSG